MSEPQNFLKALKDGQELLVPLLLLDGNYISYTSAPASPDSEGIEGIFKPAPDGLYYYTEGLWRKAPVYTTNWDDLSDDVRFLPVNKEITLSKAERKLLRKAISIELATTATEGLVRGSYSSAQYGAVSISSNGQATVPLASDAFAGVVRVTDINQGETLAPVVATKQYVDTAINNATKVQLEPPTANTLGGIMLGADIEQCDGVGRLIVNKASYTASDRFGIVHMAPEQFTLNTSSTLYDDNNTDIPYVVTVSQAKEIAKDIASKPVIVKTDNIASTSQLGFVQISSGAGLSITAAGVLSANIASPTQKGIVQIFNEDVSDLDLPSAVPYMAQVKSYIQSKNYITATLIPLATSSSIGGIKIKSNSAAAIDLSGAMTIRQASTDKSGIVLLVVSPPATENYTVLTAYLTLKAIDNKIVTIPDATISVAGKVYVLPATTDLPNIALIVPTVNYMNGLIQGITSSATFDLAVRTIIDTYSGGGAKLQWKINIFGPGVTDTDYSLFQGSFADGATFNVTVNPSEKMDTVEGVTAAFFSVSASRPCTKDELYPKLVQLAGQIRTGNPIIITIVE